MRKLLFIMHNLCGGGAEKALIDILKRLDYSIYSVDLCLIFNVGVYLKEIPGQVNLICLYNGNERFQQRWEHKLSRGLCLDYFQEKRIKHKVREQYDVIISFMEGGSLKFHNYLVEQAKLNITWVHTELRSNHYTKSWFRNDHDEQSYYKKMDKIVFVSNGAKDSFDELFSVKNIAKEVIYNPIDKIEIIKKAEEYQINHNKFTICSVGRLSEQKKFDRLLRVAKRLKDERYDIQFIVLGDGEYFDRLMALRKELSLEDYVFFLGFKSPPYAYMKSADMYLSVSSVEGLPLVICEALCLGLPVVSTKTAGAMELLDNDRYGILTEHDDESIYIGIRKLLDNTKLVDEYKNKALQRSNIFNIFETMEDINKLLTHKPQN